MYYITVDIETTGLDIYKAEPIQMAYMVHDDHDKLLLEKSFTINVGYPLPEIITKITGHTKQSLIDTGIDKNSACMLWRGMLKSYQPATLIGYNIINFDFPIIQNWINQLSNERYKFPPICQIFDVMIMIASKTNSPWMKLGAAAAQYEIEFKVEDLHDAMADVRITWEIYKKIRN